MLNEENVESIKKGIQTINYLKNLPIKEHHKAEVKIFEYNKKSKSGMLEIINTDLFKVKYSKSIPFYIDESTEQLENEILQNMINEDTLLVKYEPIIYDHIEYKELKKMHILNIER